MKTKTQKAWVPGIPRIANGQRVEVTVKLKNGKKRQLHWLENYELEEYGIANGWFTCRTNNPRFALFFEPYTNGVVTHYQADVAS